MKQDFLYSEEEELNSESFAFNSQLPIQDLDEEDENDWDMDDDDDDYREDARNRRNQDEDTFDALTDGKYGDYDDFSEGGGDLDYLRDCLGF